MKTAVGWRKEPFGSHLPNSFSRRKLERLFTDAAPEVVDVTVPADGHHVVLEAVAGCGAHALVETPIAISLPCADRMIAAAGRAGVKLEVSENVWRFPEERMKRAVLDSGILGDPLRGYVVFSSGSYHAMNALRAYMGFATPAAEVRSAAHRWEVPEVLDHAGRRLAAEEWRLGLIRFAGGRMGVYEYANTASGPLRGHVPRYYRVDTSRGSLVNAEVYRYDGAQARLYMMEKMTREEGGLRVLERIRIGTDPSVEWINPLRRYRLTAGHLAVASALAGLHRAIVAGGEPEYGAANARADLELAIALEELARRGEPVALPLTAMTEHERELHARYAERYGHDPLDTAPLLERAFPQV